MKGLIIKDIMCLKKQLTVFVYVLAGVLLVSVMYVLSARFGNIARAGKEMLASNDMTAVDVTNLGTMALVFFMLLPIACIGDMANVFISDGKAGFHKVAGALPVPLKKRLLARYFTIYALFGIGVLVDILIAFLLSALTDLINFGDFLGIIISSASVMSIYSSLVIFFCLLIGYGKEQYAQIFALITMGLMAFLANLKTIKTIFADIIAASSGPGDNAATAIMWNTLYFIKDKAWVLLLIAVAISVLSYAASFAVAERKRGVI